MNFPNINVYSRNDEETPPFFDAVPLSNILANKRAVVIGVPAAFNPADAQLMEYDSAYSQLIDLGIDEVYCICPNDPDVVEAWKDSLSVTNVEMIADGNNEFATRSNKVWPASEIGFGQRLMRMAMVTNNGEIEYQRWDNGTTENDLYHSTTVSGVISHLS